MLLLGVMEFLNPMAESKILLSLRAEHIEVL